MKRIYLCRHAKSSWNDPSLEDFNRPLNKRGKRDLPLMAERLHSMAVLFDAMYSSPAKRAIRTAKGLAAGVGFSKKKIVRLEQMYGASHAFLISLIQGLDPDLQSVALVGHNPEMTMLANMLAGEHFHNVPTCGIVAVDFETTDWHFAAPGYGQLAFFEYPKKQVIDQEK